MTIIITEKICSKCGLLKPLTAYYKDNSSLDGRRSSCKSCTYTKKKKTPKTEKRCWKCEEIKPVVEEFYDRTSRCKSCTTRRKSKPTTNVHQLALALSATVTMKTGTKRCRCCDQILEVEEFGIRSRSIDGFTDICRVCNILEAEGMTHTKSDLEALEGIRNNEAKMKEALRKLEKQKKDDSDVQEDLDKS